MSSGVKLGVPSSLDKHVAQQRRQLKRIRLLGEAGGFLELSGARVATLLALDDLAHSLARYPQRGADGAKASTRAATLNDLPIAIAYHCAASVFIKASMQVGVCHSMHNVSYFT